MTQADLIADNAKLRAMNAHLVDRIAAAAEVLGAVANRLPVCRCQLERAAEYPTVDEAIEAARYAVLCLGAVGAGSSESPGVTRAEARSMFADVCERWPWVKPGGKT